MEKLQQLMSLCRCGVYVSVNEHRDLYETAEQRLEDYAERGEEIAAEVRAKMIELDTVVELQFYPDTPVGFYLVVHYDLDSALTIALDTLNSRSASVRSSA